MRRRRRPAVRAGLLSIVTLGIGYVIWGFVSLGGAGPRRRGPGAVVVDR